MHFSQPATIGKEEAFSLWHIFSTTMHAYMRILKTVSRHRPSWWYLKALEKGEKETWQKVASLRTGMHIFSGGRRVLSELGEQFAKHRIESSDPDTSMCKGKQHAAAASICSRHKGFE